MKIIFRVPILLISLLACDSEYQVYDSTFAYDVKNPAYAAGEGPLVLVDEAHNNFHTTQGRYIPFVKLVSADGYAVQSVKSKIDHDLLSNCKIFITSVPMAEDYSQDFVVFSGDEIAILHNWVKNGGALFMITDHAPDPAAIEHLAAKFGIMVNNGYVLNVLPEQAEEKPMLFRRIDRTLSDHPITQGRNDTEKIDSVATFTGCAFTTTDNYQSLLTFSEGRKSWMPEQEWVFADNSLTVDVGGWSQGAVAEYGLGRVAFFGEAAMFTAQLFGDYRVPGGMNHPLASQNAQFLLNVMHWLSGLL